MTVFQNLTHNGRAAAAPGPSNSDDAQLDESAEALLAAMEKYHPIVRTRRAASTRLLFF